MRVGVLASHHGTTIQALIDIGKTFPDALQVAVVISNNRDAGALERARKHTIPFFHLSGSTCKNPEELDVDIRDALLENKVDIIFLAGYLRKLGPKTLAAFPNRILNTHPSLLPDFGGKGMFGNKVHEAVLASGEVVIGVTIHLVDGEYDTGKIISQCKIQVEADDTVETLAARSAQCERTFVAETLLHISRGEISLP